MYVRVCACVRMCVYVRACMRVCVCVCVCVRMSEYEQSWMHTPCGEIPLCDEIHKIARKCEIQPGQHFDEE